MVRSCVQEHSYFLGPACLISSGGIEEGAGLLTDDLCIVHESLGHVQHVTRLQNDLRMHHEFLKFYQSIG